MKVFIFDTPEAASEAVSKKLVGKVIDNPCCCLGLATGGTVKAVYRSMTRKFEKREVSYREVRTFNLDEYVGLSPDHPMSYRTYMNNHLFERTDFQTCNTRIPVGDTADSAVEAERYEAEIIECGGIDCQLLGIGENGHIGFNEPTSSLSSATRIKTLAPETVLVNSRFFQRTEEVPRLSITMGIGSILRAKEVVLLAIGKNKSAAVSAMIEGPLSARCPASALQLHSHADIFLDTEAASLLMLREYYDAVHPNGSAE